jgi:hypothetical protein
MIYYINWALLIVFIVFFAAQLKHNGKVTQKHFTGDWRQKLHKKFTDKDFLLTISWGISIVLSIISATYLFFDDVDNHSGEVVLFALIMYTFGVAYLSLFYLFPIGCIISIVIKIFPDYIYYNPEGKYVLEKDKLSGKYDVCELYKYPEECYYKIKIPQFIGQDNNLGFAEKGDVFKQIFKRNDRGIIIASFSEKTLSEYEEWLRGVNYR